MIPLPFMHGYVVALLGLGRSGLAAARALQASGAELWAWDDGEDARAKAAAAGVPLVDLAAANWHEPVSLVLSPGIPHTHPKPHPVCELARRAGVEIIGDIELLGRADPDARFVGITGTNGKSTTTALIGHVMQLARRQVEVGGNLGPPVLAFDPVGSEGFYVLEMSSYQLELTRSITFDVAVLLNISPDHLDRHGGMDGYVAAKRQIFRRQVKPRTAVVGIDDAVSAGICAELQAKGDQRVLPVSAERPAPGGVYVRDGVLIDDSQGGAVAMIDLREVERLPGRHNWQNAAAAYATCVAVGVDPTVVTACIRSFPGLPHRQERAAEAGGIVFVNDSKATNADATAKALACYEPIYWIVGGRPKETGLDGLEPFFPRIAEAFLIGEATEAFARKLQGNVAFQRCGTLERATEAAFASARQAGRGGAVVLLSPACASFDQFANFEARGDAFRALARAIAEREAA